MFPILLLEQFANSSLPPPPFPPVPIPQFGFHSYAPVRPPVNGQQRATSNAKNQAALVAPPEVRIGDVSPLNSSVEDNEAREEGELSDRELNEDTSGSERVTGHTGTAARQGPRQVTSNSNRGRPQKQSFTGAFHGKGMYSFFSMFNVSCLQYIAGLSCEVLPDLVVSLSCHL